MDDGRVGKNKRGLIVSFVAEVVAGAAIGTERTARTRIVAGFGFVGAGFCAVVSEHFAAKHTLKMIKKDNVILNLRCKLLYDNHSCK